MSKSFIAKFLERIYASIEAPGVDPKIVHPYFTAPLLCITSFLEHLKKSYGSAKNYLLKQAGISDSTLLAMREQLLK